MTPWLKSRPELETVSKSQPKKFTVSKNVAEVVGVTSAEGFLVIIGIIFIDDTMTTQICSSSDITIYQNYTDVSHSHDQETRTITTTVTMTRPTDRCTVRRRMKHGVSRLISRGTMMPGCCWRWLSVAVSGNCLRRLTTAPRLNSPTSYRRWYRPTVRTPPSRLRCPLLTSRKTPNL